MSLKRPESCAKGRGCSKMPVKAAGRINKNVTCHDIFIELCLNESIEIISPK